MPETKDYEKYRDDIPLSDKLLRLTWRIIRLIFFSPFSLPWFNNWRIFLLKCFGAKIGKGCIVYSSAYIPAPWNLTMGNISCIGPDVQLHIGKTFLGSKVTISQRSYLCSASHEITSLNTPFVSGKIVVGDYAWIAAESFVMMNVTIGEGAIVGARSAVFRDVEPWNVVGGNPAKYIKKRTIDEK
ncbi:putative colanic acid biosynthesis acetyltransferase [Dyadobacter sp. CY345]|uniref:putative colanic acid biosynthesis acetyltransferase n=1 Tax=Dyadobacter sp. CY345 TaxID=2909335 RepID=UPI001F491427|nr:putative colanic acid biosynthesis acetyltransferase [Dyadobacter sp. CY345]MCF2447052.1 putative colanic acid biosynthesis acetyltransferase [Dyadobacter sp. CY345]